jgi:hypothetical protein
VSKQVFRFGLEIPVLGAPLRVDRRVEGPLQKLPRLWDSSIIDSHLGEKKERGGAVRVVRQRTLKMFHGLRVTAAEQPWDLEIPDAKRAVSRTLLPGCINGQHPLELVLDSSAVLQPLHHAVRLGKGPHVRGRPEVAVRPPGLEGGGLLPGGYAATECVAPAGLRTSGAQPIQRARQFPTRLEVMAALRPRGPYVNGAHGARQVFPAAIQFVRVDGLALRRRPEEIECENA